MLWSFLPQHAIAEVVLNIMPPHINLKKLSFVDNEGLDRSLPTQSRLTILNPFCTLWLHTFSRLAILHSFCLLSNTVLSPGDGWSKSYENCK